VSLSEADVARIAAAVVAELVRRGLAPEASAAVVAGDGTLDADQVAARLKMSRRNLNRLLLKLPAGLPGAPANVGTGSRPVWRWSAATFDDWLAAIAEHRRRRRRPSSRKQAPRSSGNVATATDAPHPSPQVPREEAAPSPRRKLTSLVR
jgi:hypothetical protein